MRILKQKREKKLQGTIRGEKEKVRKNKMLVLRKRQVAAASLILLIGIAGYLNISIKEGGEDPNISVMYNEASKRLGEAKMVSTTEEEEKTDDGKNNDTKVGADYFTNAKEEREKKRSESMEMLKEVLNSTGADKESKLSAEKQIEKLSLFTEAEVSSENMIKAKGYGDCVVFMGENVTSVAVSTNGLNEIDAAVIIEIIASTGVVSPEQVKIVEIKPN